MADKDMYRVQASFRLAETLTLKIPKSIASGTLVDNHHHSRLRELMRACQ